MNNEVLDITSNELRDKINDILTTRLHNEQRIGKAVEEGLDSELKEKGVIQLSTLDGVSKILNRNKDSVSDLVKMVRLIDGDSTENLVMTKEEINKKLEMVVHFEASGTLEKIEALVRKIGGIKDEQSGEVVDASFEVDDDHPSGLETSSKEVGDD